MPDSAISRLFDDIAPWYDLLNQVLSLTLDRRWRARAIRAVALPAGARVLDVCTGTADIALALARHAPTAAIYGVDFARNMLRAGRQKVARRRLEQHITLLQADALHLPFPDNLFDAIWISFGLRNLTDRPRGLHEFRRVLRPAGRLVILEFSPPPRPWFGNVFCVYLTALLPQIGRNVSRSPSAYRYLATSITNFPEPETITELLHTSGFREIACQRLMFGVLHLYIASKREE